MARIVLGLSSRTGGNFEFIVKSGQFPDMASIHTVNRTLREFLFLRSQLGIEYPEAGLYVNAYFSSKQIRITGPGFFYKTQRKLDAPG